MGEKIVKRILEVNVYENTRTIDLMDHFEGYGKDVAYLQMVLRNIACVNINGKYEYISLIVERCKDHRYVGDITFTELKQGQTRGLYDFLRNQISAEIIDEYKKKSIEFRFDTPYLFRAQNSTNRSGYGWGYSGTQYGETTAYTFVGAYLGYRNFGFVDAINAEIEAADLSEFSIKNTSVTPTKYIPENKSDGLLILDDEDDEEIELEIFPEEECAPNACGENILDSEIELIVEKRNIPDDEKKQDWFYAGFSPVINMFVLALEQKIYLPPIIDECESCMQTDENVQGDQECILTDLEKSFMFVEMLANRIGYSGASVLSLDSIHKRKILNNLLLRNVDCVEFGEYGENSISMHLVAEFLENQAELNYTGYVEIILSRYTNAEGNVKYELLGGFRDFGDNEVPLSNRCYWIGRERYLLDEEGNGSYLQGFYEMAMNMSIHTQN